MRNILTALFIVCFSMTVITSTQAHKVCTQDEAKQAEESISGLSSWSMVYGSFRQYSHCDDGAIAEGYDDKIVDLLTNHWDLIDDLYKLSKAHPRFERFVLHPIDTLMSPDQAKSIIENASKHCPPEAKGLCMKLEKKAQNPE
jgi:hypothetical protein